MHSVNSVKLQLTAHPSIEGHSHQPEMVEVGKQAVMLHVATDAGVNPRDYIRRANV